MKYINKYLVNISILIFLFSCSERRPIGRAADARYIEDSSEKGLVNLDKINSQDFTRASNKLLQDLFITGALAKAPDQPVVLHIGEIRNDTQTYFDTDLLIQGNQSTFHLVQCQRIWFVSVMIIDLFRKTYFMRDLELKILTNLYKITFNYPFYLIYYQI